MNTRNGGSESKVYLVCGTNESNADTIIVANIDPDNGIAHFISLPRDIYIKGRKINSYYRDFGADKFRTVIEQVTGLEIHRYLFVDMYAFVEIVNILGGIDIVLEEDLADPTYRVRNNGIWSTLYYPKGRHHLDGIEALRVARARHFTPVFSRDDRQQKILSALIEKVKEISMTDFQKIYEMMKTVFTYLDTDISFQESIKALNDLRNIKKTYKTVISTQNVLEQTYSSLLHMGIDIEEAGDDFDLGAWILIPKNNDWNEIHTFIKKTFKGNNSEYEILD